MTEQLTPTLPSTGCSPCDYDREHGWWGPSISGTHCSGCHRSWTGLAEGHCFTCHLHFGQSDRPWDAHFDGTRHRSLGELLGLCTDEGTPRFKVVERASGPVVVNHSDSENPFAAARAS